MKNINFDGLKALLLESKSKRVMITFHSMGDTDAIASALGLLKFFSNATIATPDFITANSKRILEKLDFNHKIIKENFDDTAEMVVLVDVNNFEDCGRFKPKLESFAHPILIIDHHSPKNNAKDNVTVFNDESYNSAASIVYDLLRSSGLQIEGNLANLIATGIISDSAELRNAFPKTFVQIGELLEKSKIDYPSILLEMQHIAPPQTREDFIKDLFKAKISMKGGMLVLSGRAQTHANKIADDAIRIGADASLFCSINEKEVSFSARLRPPLDKTHGIDLGKIMKSLAPLIKGQGGGHPCAAGAYGSQISNADKFTESFMAEIDNGTKS